MNQRSVCRIFKRTFGMILISAFLGACAHSIHDVHVSNFTPYGPIQQKGELIQAEATQFVVFWFTTQTRFVDEAYQQFQNKCPQGAIGSIVTQYTTDLGFFSWKNRLKLQGICRKS